MNEELSFKSQMCLKNAMGSQVRGREAGGAVGAPQNYWNTIELLIPRQEPIVSNSFPAGNPTADYWLKNLQLLE